MNQNPEVVIYARVSSKEQYEEGYSIEAQLRLLRSHAEKSGYRIVKEYVDIETAKQSGRTHFTEMVQFLERERKKKSPCRIILVEKTDRLYRNFRDYVTIDELDVDCHFVKDNQILSKESRSTEKFIHGIKVLMAKNYIDNLSEEAKKGMHEKAMQGIWPSKAPLGYLNAEKDGKKIIVVDPQLAPLIKKVYEWYATGQYSLLDVTKIAHEHGLIYPSSKAKVPASTVHRILKNSLYTGDMDWNGRFYKGIHEPIISKSLYEEVQTLFRERGKHKPRRHKYEWAFAGLVTCGHCGASYTAERKKGRFIYYRCSFSRQKCKEPYVREEVLSERFAQAIAAIRLDKETLDWILETLRGNHEEEQRFQEEHLKSLRNELRTLKARLHSMYEDKLDGKIDGDFFDAKARDWKGQMERIEEQIAQHETADRSYLDEGIRLLELVQNAIPLFEKQDRFEQRRILNFVVSNSVWINGELTVKYKKPFDSLAVTLAEEQEKFQPGELEARRAEKWLGC